MADSLSCQRCHQPLLRDQSVANLTPSQLHLVSSTLPETPPSSTLTPQAKLAALPPASRASAAAWSSANNSSVSESFVLLPDRGERTSKPPPAPDSPSPSSPSRVASPASQPQLAARLDALLSSRTNIDHPLCTECTGLFQAELQRELEGLTHERDAYIAFERGLRKRDRDRSRSDVDDDPSADDTALVGTAEEWDALISRKRELEEEERILRQTLKEREDELQRVREDEALAKAEEAAVEQDEADFLKSQAALSGQLTHLAHQLSSAKTQLALSTQLLQHLESTNVYNDAFQIGHAPAPNDAHGNVGTINGLRLGGRPTVEWEEINAAWGLVALCIDRLAVRVGCVFETYKIIPLGSFSRIEETTSKGAYELYASSDISPARLLQNRRFSYALVALLDCLRQLLAFGKEAGRAWGSGVEIHKDKINGHSIRLPGFAGLPAFGSMSFLGGVEEPGANDEAWTKACRAVLTALKRILVVESEAERGV